MPRTTRAAARADPALADETMAVAEIAIAEDTTIVNIDQASTEAQVENREDASRAVTETRRAPLGEIALASERVNHTDQTIAESSSSDEENRVVAIESESEGSSAQEENVVMLLGAKAKDQSPGKVKKTGKTSSNKGSKQSSKNSIRLQIKEPHAQHLLQQLRTTTAKKPENASSFKAEVIKTSASDSSLSNLGSSEDNPALKPDNTVPLAVKLDEVSASVSPAPLEAASLLNAPTTEVVTSDSVNDTTSARTPSPAALQASRMLKRKESVVTRKATGAQNKQTDTKTTRANPTPLNKQKLPATKHKPASTSSASKPVRQTSTVSNKKSSTGISGAAAHKESQSQAVQKLASLFEPQSEDTNNTQANEASPLNNVLVTQPMSPFTDSKDPIEAMDALEENIEAIEKSIADCDKKSSPSKRVTNSSSNNVDGEKNAGATNQQSKARTLVATSKKRESVSKRQSTNLHPRTVEALNTPPALQKSTKPLTVSKFNLSSEATAARLRAQREERQKRREEEEQKQKQAKPKPAKATVKPVEVRTTTASRARTSLLAEKPKETGAGDQSSHKRKSAAVGPATVGRVQGLSSALNRPSQSISPLKTKQNGKSSQPLVGRKTISPGNSKVISGQIFTIQATNPTQSASVGRKSLPNTTTKVSRPSTVHATTKRPSMPPHVSSKNNSIINVKSSSKSTASVNSDANMKKDRELTTKAKAEAAQKARLEAAERGRAASREWAERKKRRVTSSKLEVVSEDVPRKEPILVQDSRESGGNKENKGEASDKPDEIPIATAENQELDTLKINGLAKSVLLGNTPSQDAAAYIVAEMKRIEKIRSSLGQP